MVWCKWMDLYIGNGKVGGLVLGVECSNLVDWVWL